MDVEPVDGKVILLCILFIKSSIRIFVEPAAVNNHGSEIDFSTSKVDGNRLVGHPLSLGVTSLVVSDKVKINHLRIHWCHIVQSRVLENLDTVIIVPVGNKIGPALCIKRFPGLIHNQLCCIISIQPFIQNKFRT